MHRSWWFFAITAIFSETFCAVRPLIPVSISSKIKVSIWSRSARIAFRASMILESSPPDTIFPRGFRLSPGLVEISYSTSSNPFSEKLFFCRNVMANCTSRKFRSFKPWITFSSSCLLYSFRTTESPMQAFSSFFWETASSSFAVWKISSYFWSLSSFSCCFFW